MRATTWRAATSLIRSPLQKDLPSGRRVNTDQFTLAITGGTPAIVGGNTATTAGAATGLQPQIAGPVFGRVGTAYAINETASGGTDLNAYAKSWSCVNNGGATIASGDSLPAAFVMPDSGNNGSNVLCTIANTPGQQVSLRKMWVGGAAGDSINVATTGAPTNPSVSSAAPNTVTGAAVGVVQGTILTLPAETFSPPASAANYEVTLECTGGSPLAPTTTLPANLTITNSVTPTVCTYTNALLPQLTLQKSVINDNGGTAVETDFTLTATGPTPGASGVEGDAAITNAAVSAGVYTLSETNLPGLCGGRLELRWRPLPATS